MRDIWTIAWREYRTRVSSPVFIAVTVLMFMVLVGGPVVGVLVFNATGAKPITISVIDATGRLWPGLQAAMADAGGPSGVQLQPAGMEQETALLTRARSGDLPGLLLLQGATPEEFRATFSSSSMFTLERVKDKLQPVLEVVVRAERLQGYQVDPGVLRVIQEPVSMNFVPLNTSEADDDAYEVRTLIATVFNMLMYVAVLAYAALTFQGVLEEKTSRVMELLVAAVKPEVLLAGKVLGIGLVGLTQYATWVLAYIALLGLPFVVVSAALAKISSAIFLFGLVYFLLGYFLYAALYAAAASTISRMEDSQALLMPLTLLVVVGNMVAMFVLQNPSGPLATWFSLIPFFSPSVMITRLVLSQPPAWQVAVSVGLLLLATVGTIWAAARIYRVGVLLYGARPTWRLIWRYLRVG